MVSTNPARGMRDFLPADVRKREYVIGIIKQVYESYGFEPLETPAVENLETLIGKYGDEGNQLVFRILKRGEAFAANLKGFAGVVNAGSYGEYEINDPSYATAITKEFCDLALRYDLTVPLARVVANNKNELPKFFKRYQIQPVWRADRPARGRFREFYQCDVDVIGSESRVVEAELISAVSAILTELGFKDFVIRLNDRQLLDAIMDVCQIPAELYGSTLTVLDKLDRIGEEQVKVELVNLGLALNIVDTLIYWTTNKQIVRGNFEHKDFSNSTSVNDSQDFLNTLSGQAHLIRGLEEDKTKLTNSYQKLSALFKNLASYDSDNIRVRFDPSLARGLSYYTGTIMEINVDGIGSLGGGGRYDGLIGMFGKEQIPACGFSLGLERILVVMEERGMFPPEIADSTPADVLVTIFSDETVADSLKLANELRTSGLRVTLYPQADKEDRQWKYANSIKVPWICTVNRTDIDEGFVSFQNLRTRERYREPMDKVAAKMKE